MRDRSDYVAIGAVICLAISLAICLLFSPSRHELANILTWPMNTGKHGAYNFFSGIGIDSFVGLAVYLKHHNCHSRWCLRTGHKHPEHGWPVCRRHYHRALDVSASGEFGSDSARASG